MDPESTRLFSALRAALLRAMTESSEMCRALDQLRANGWSAYVVIDGETEDSPAPGARLVSQAEQAAGRAAWSSSDRSFLRSLGIDPSSASSSV